ncbi:MAG: hypothetical protein LBD75_06145 [Candidatus Peribacteria bacterium]|jgi:preprotein translocase subunit SecG|nr:hypothetical protein [Candidatus Peribacteria bacterium]
MREEKKIVSWALIILFLSLTIIYSLVYMRKREVFLVNEDSKQQDKGEEEQEDNEKKQEQKADTQTIVPPVIYLSIGHEEPSI